MRLTEDKLRDLLSQQTARSTPRQRDCLGEDQFMRAAAGDMNSDERRAVARHLITCADCTEEYQLLRSLKPWSEEVQASLSPSGARVRRIRPSLRIVDKPAPRPARESFARSLLPSRTALALAASLLIILLLGGWLLLTRYENNRRIAGLNAQLMERERMLGSADESLDQMRRRLEESSNLTEERKPAGASAEETARLQRQIADLRRTVNRVARPQLDAPIIDLDPADATRGDSKEAATMIEVSPTANLVTLILNSSHKKRSRYAVEIFSHLGKRVWRGEGSQRVGTNSVNVTFPRNFVPAGLYVIKLYGLNGTTELIAEYAVQIGK